MSQGRPPQLGDPAQEGGAREGGAARMRPATCAPALLSPSCASCATAGPPQRAFGRPRPRRYPRPPAPSLATLSGSCRTLTAASPLHLPRCCAGTRRAYIAACCPAASSSGSDTHCGGSGSSRITTTGGPSQGATRVPVSPVPYFAWYSCSAAAVPPARRCPRRTSSPFTPSLPPPSFHPPSFTAQTINQCRLLLRTQALVLRLVLRRRRGSLSPAPAAVLPSSPTPRLANRPAT